MNTEKSEKQEQMVNLTVYSCQIPVQAFFDRIQPQFLQNALVQNSSSFQSITNQTNSNQVSVGGGGGGGGGGLREESCHEKNNTEEEEKISKKKKIQNDECLVKPKAKQSKKENKTSRYVKASWFHRLDDFEQPVDCLLCKTRITFDNREKHFEIHFTKFIFDQSKLYQSDADINRLLGDYLVFNFRTYRQKEIIYEEAQKKDFSFLRHQPFLEFIEAKRKESLEN